MHILRLILWCLILTGMENSSEAFILIVIQFFILWFLSFLEKNKKKKKRADRILHLPQPLVSQNVPSAIFVFSSGNAIGWNVLVKFNVCDNCNRLKSKFGEPL